MTVGLDVQTHYSVLDSTESHWWTCAKYDELHALAAAFLVGSGVVAYLATLSGDDVNTGGSVTIDAAASDEDITSCSLDSTHGIVCWWVGNTLKGCVATRSGDSTINKGTTASIVTSSAGTKLVAAARLTDTKAIVAYSDSSGGVSAIILSISGTDITPETATVVDTSAPTIALHISADPGDANAAVVFYAPNATALTISGTTITAGTPHATCVSTEPAWGVTITSAGVVVVVHKNATSTYGRMHRLTRTGTALADDGTAADVTASGTNSAFYAGIAAMSSPYVLVMWRSTAGDGKYHWELCNAAAEPPTGDVHNDATSDGELSPNVSYPACCALSSQLAFVAYRNDQLEGPNKAWFNTVVITGLPTTRWRVGSLAWGSA